MDNNNLYNQVKPGDEQGQFQQQPYQQPYQNAYQPSNSELEEPVSFGEWMITMLLMAIPCVNIVMIFVWAFGNGAKKSKSNYFKAVLVWALISIVLSIVIVAVFGASLAAISSSMYY